MLRGKRWKMVAAVGQGVLFALALTGLVRWGFLATGNTLPDEVAGRLFLWTSLVAGGTASVLYVRNLNDSEPETPATPPQPE